MGLLSSNESRQIYLVCHGEEQKLPIGDGDQDISLSRNGVNQTLQLLECFKEGMAPPPHHVFCSTVLCARQTAELLNEAFPKTQVVFHRLLCWASDQCLLDMIHQWDDGLNRVMLIGHNPGLQNLLQLLVFESNELIVVPPAYAECAVLDFDACDTWRSVDKNMAHVSHFLTHLMHCFV